MDMWSKDKIFNDSGVFLLGFQRDHQQWLLCGSQSQGPALLKQWLVSWQLKEQVEGGFVYKLGDHCRPPSLCCHGANAIERTGWCVSDPHLPQLLPPLVIISVWCLENPMERGAWQAAGHRVTKSQSWLKQLSTHALEPHTTLYCHFHGDSSTPLISPKLHQC